VLWAFGNCALGASFSLSPSIYPCHQHKIPFVAMINIIIRYPFFWTAYTVVHVILIRKMELSQSLLLQQVPGIYILTCLPIFCSWTWCGQHKWQQSIHSHVGMYYERSRPLLQNGIKFAADNIDDALSRY
jgi:hypothetical protein